MTSNPKRVLFLAPPQTDYLSALLLAGFREIPDLHVIDRPRYRVAYDDFPEAARKKVYGRGFTAFFNVPAGSRAAGEDFGNPKPEEIDLFIFSDIWRQPAAFIRYLPFLKPTNTVICDGADSPYLFPYSGRFMTRFLRFLPRFSKVKGFLYFKREWTTNSPASAFSRILPSWISERIPCDRPLRPISFAFPTSSILAGAGQRKSKDFPKHIVDRDLLPHLPESVSNYAFATQAEYYHDLRSSRFGVTMKRSGWDCMRHYEIAANGSVPCFKNLHSKPSTCAPHGLKSGFNCIAYETPEHLFSSLARLDFDQYERIRRNALQWAASHSTVLLARYVLETFEAFLRDRAGTTARSHPFISTELSQTGQNFPVSATPVR